MVGFREGKSTKIGVDEDGRWIMGEGKHWWRRLVNDRIPRVERDENLKLGVKQNFEKNLDKKLKGMKLLEEGEITFLKLKTIRLWKNYCFSKLR